MQTQELTYDLWRRVDGLPIRAQGVVLPPTRKIAIEFEADVQDARALARALLAVWTASRAAGEGFIAVDGFQMNKSVGWRGDCRITVEDR
jgi:hypothetical protein